MDEPKPKFVSRSVALGANARSFSPGPARSPWHGMDLLTTTPSSTRRAMYTPPPQNSPSSSPAAHPQVAAKVKADDAAMSARNLVLRRKLSERKRFDSADYAMKTVMRAMHAPGPEDSEPQMPSTPTAASSSPTLSPSHARMGASVLKDALNDGDFEMKSSEDSEPTTATQSQQPSSSSRYGAIGRNGMSPAGVMSARNIMIQRRMHEKRHFDSADWQLAQYGVQTDAAMDTAPMELDAIASPTATPSAQLYARMSPSVRSTSSSNAHEMMMTSQQQQQQAQADESKYAGLSGSNELLQRRLAEKKRFDSADYNMVRSSSATPSAESQLRRTAILRQQQQSFVARQSTEPPPAPSAFFSTAATAAPPAPVEQTPLAVAAEAAATTSKYGKLCAANVLLRKKLKERKRFDSADYQMERAKHSDSDPPVGSSSPVLNPQAKHIKLSDGAAPSRWATHAAVVAMKPAATSHAAREASAAAPVSMEGRLAARSVLIHRHLAERKRFDSADHFAAKEAARRGSRHHA